MNDEEIMAESAKVINFDRERLDATKSNSGTPRILIAPIEVLTDSRLSDTQRRVLLALYSFRNKHSDTVFPSLPVLAARAGIKDHTRVSKATSALQNLDWLKKRKRGFTGGNEYLLQLPESLLQGEVENTKLDNYTKLAKNTKTNLDEDTKPKLDKGAKYNKQTNEQTNEQLKENARKRASTSALDFSSWPAKPTESVLNDWLKIRRAKRAPLNQTAIDRMATELHRASASGMSVDECLGICCERGWQGFKLEWTQNTAARFSPPGRTSTPRNFEGVDYTKGLEGFDND